MITWIRNKIRLWFLKRYLTKAITRDIWRSPKVQTEAEKIEAVKQWYENVITYQVYRGIIERSKRDESSTDTN